MWPILKKAPIVLTVFQIKYKLPEKFDIRKFYKSEATSDLKKYYPKRNTNYNSSILDLENTPAPGISTLKAKTDTQANIITYSTEDEKNKIILDLNSLTIASEDDYTKWDSFKMKQLTILSYFSEVLTGIEIERISIRFINRFELEKDVNILDYFNLAVSTQKTISFPIMKYSFKYIVNATDDGMCYSIINHSMEPTDEHLIYLMDIDVLKRVDYVFNQQDISSCLEELRHIKNTLFFENITRKTIDLCNSQP